MLDGEVVALDGEGRSDFERLQSRMGLAGSPAKAARRATKIPAHLMLFDIVFLDAHDLTRSPYAVRRTTLESLALAGAAWSTPAAVIGHGQQALDMTRTAGLEGLIAKRLTSLYEPSVRSRGDQDLARADRGHRRLAGWSATAGSPPCPALSSWANPAPTDGSAASSTSVPAVATPPEQSCPPKLPTQCKTRVTADGLRRPPAHRSNSTSQRGSSPRTRSVSAVVSSVSTAGGGSFSPRRSRPAPPCDVPPAPGPEEGARAAQLGEVLPDRDGAAAGRVVPHLALARGEMPGGPPVGPEKRRGWPLRPPHPAPTPSRPPARPVAPGAAAPAHPPCLLLMHPPPRGEVPSARPPACVRSFRPLLSPCVKQQVRGFSPHQQGLKGLKFRVMT
ncbi:ATP-dependent DNA ligase [Streptomyces microflavus]|uniref:ATP-dependent DNA ligase n=1 Tax=Streptomyces microflavus TaxID=1919 RepID=UPI0040638490